MALESLPEHRGRPGSREAPKPGRSSKGPYGGTAERSSPDQVAEELQDGPAEESQEGPLEELQEDPAEEQREGPLKDLQEGSLSSSTAASGDAEEEQRTADPEDSGEDKNCKEAPVTRTPRAAEELQEGPGDCKNVQQKSC